MMCLSSSRDHSIVNLSTSTYAYTLIHQYGFTKKSRKRGPEADGMYSHPGFVRGNCEGLSLLRKRTKTKSIIQKNQASSISSFPSPGSTGSAPFSYGFQSLRVISPTNSTDDGSSVSSNSSLDGSSRHKGRRNSEGLAMLADAMLMMIGER